VFRPTHKIPQEEKTRFVTISCQTQQNLELFEQSAALGG
jgi:ribosomal protein S27E